MLDRLNWKSTDNKYQMLATPKPQKFYYLISSSLKPSTNYYYTHKKPNIAKVCLVPKKTFTLRNSKLNSYSEIEWCVNSVWSTTMVANTFLKIFGMQNSHLSSDFKRRMETKQLECFGGNFSWTDLLYAFLWWN